MIQPFAHEMFSALAQGGTWQAQRTYYHSIHLFLSFHWPRAEESRSFICLRLRLRQIIDLLSTDTKSPRYLAHPRPISRTISFSNLSITHTKSFSLPVEHCNFTPDFSNHFQFLFPWRIEKSGFHCTLEEIRYGLLIMKS